MKPFDFTLLNMKIILRFTSKRHRLAVILTLLFVIFFDCYIAAQAVVKTNTGGNLVISGPANFIIKNAGLNNNGTITPGNGSFIFLGDVDTSTAKINGNSTFIFYKQDEQLNCCSSCLCIQSIGKGLNTCHNA